MKALKILTLAFMVVILCGLQTVTAQTFHKDLYAEINNEYILCLDKRVSGSWTYHVSYHLDKNGVLTKVHWNAKHTDLVDNEGNTYKIIDVGNDHIGTFFWDLFNNINAFNEPFDITYYDVEDGWLPVDAGPRPGEGVLTNNFKVIGKKGEKFYWTTYWRIKVNNNGEVIADIYNEKLDCPGVN